MQITNADIIKNGEQDLIDAITADLDWGAIENIFREQHNLGIDEDVEYKQGDIIVHDNQIAYQLQFEVKVTVSVLLDREGNYLSVVFSGKTENYQAESDEFRLAEKDEVADDEEENIRESPEKQDTPLGIEKDVKPLGEDIEEEMEKNEEDAEQKKIDEPHQIIQDKIVNEKSFDENNEDSDQKISRIASQVGEIMEELGEEISA